MIIITTEKNEREKRIEGDLDMLIEVRNRQLDGYLYLLNATESMVADAVLGGVPLDTYDIIFRERKEWLQHVKNISKELDELEKRKGIRRC